MNSFSNTRTADSYFEAKYEESFYMERTKRNHYWLGGKQGTVKIKKYEESESQALGVWAVTLRK